MYTDPETGEKKNGILEVRYSHQAMIDFIVANPTVSQNQLAIAFNRTPSWISSIIRSDSFQAALNARREELIDPELLLTIKDRFAALAHGSLTRMLEKIADPLSCPTDDFLLKSADLASRALGYGVRSAEATQVNVGVQIQVPAKAPSVEAWSAAHNPTVENGQ